MSDNSEDKILRSLHQTVKILSDTIGFKEPYTPHHQQDVSRIARAIAQIMHIDNFEIEGIRIGAILHDFGIIRIPPEILNKPGKLSPQEWDIMKQHPVHGYQMLKSIDFPWPVARMILQHHERLDGSGYPAGLSGDDIILEARILAVADVINSMISDRPWRKAFPIESALAELEKNKGTKYDIEVVLAACDLYRNQTYRLSPDYYGRDGE